MRERDALAAELDTTRQAALDSEAAVNARFGTSVAELAHSEGALKDMEARAEETIRGRDALVAELAAARQSALDAQAAVDARVAAIDAERARLELAWKVAEARADEANSEYEALAAELRAAQEAARPHAQSDERLEAAAERIRALELQLFEREKGPADQDVELLSLLEAPSPSEQAVRRAKRHRFSKPLEVHINGDVGALLDLSVGGAQVLCPKELDPKGIATLLLPSGDAPISCRGRIAWIWLEPHSKGKPRRYRAGIVFIGADEAAVSAFITRHAAK